MKCIESIAKGAAQLEVVSVQGWKAVVLEIKRARNKKEHSTRNALRTIANSSEMLQKECWVACHTESHRNAENKRRKEDGKKSVMRSILAAAGALTQACFLRWHEIAV